MDLNCKHKRFVQCDEQDHWKYRCKKCGKGLDTNDSVDLLNGEYRGIRGVYVQEVHLVRVTNSTQI